MPVTSTFSYFSSLTQSCPIFYSYRNVLKSQNLNQHILTLLTYEYSNKNDFWIYLIFWIVPKGFWILYIIFWYCTSYSHYFYIAVLCIYWIVLYLYHSHYIVTLLYCLFIAFFLLSLHFVQCSNHTCGIFIKEALKPFTLYWDIILLYIVVVSLYFVVSTVSVSFCWTLPCVPPWSVEKRCLVTLCMCKQLLMTNK